MYLRYLLSRKKIIFNVIPSVSTALWEKQLYLALYLRGSMVHLQRRRNESSVPKEPLSQTGCIWYRFLLRIIDDLQKKFKIQNLLNFIKIMYIDLPKPKGSVKSLANCPSSFKNLSGLKILGSPHKSGSWCIAAKLVKINVFAGIS